MGVHEWVATLSPHAEPAAWAKLMGHGYPFGSIRAALVRVSGSCSTLESVPAQDAGENIEQPYAPESRCQHSWFLLRLVLHFFLPKFSPDGALGRSSKMCSPLFARHVLDSYGYCPNSIFGCATTMHSGFCYARGFLLAAGLM